MKELDFIFSEHFPGNPTCVCNVDRPPRWWVVVLFRPPSSLPFWLYTDFARPTAPPPSPLAP